MDFDEVADELYAVPPEDFTAARTAVLPPCAANASCG